MSALSDAKLREIYDSKGCHDAGLRAVADAAIAADRAARAEPVAYRVSREGGYNCFISAIDTEMLELARLSGYLVEPLYTAPPAAPVVTTEEGRHCGDPDCVPCRDPAEPAGEQVGLTDAEVKEHFHHGSRTCKVSGPMNARDLAGIRQVIAAHEAKKAGGGV